MHHFKVYLKAVTRIVLILQGFEDGSNVFGNTILTRWQNLMGP